MDEDNRLVEAQDGWVKEHPYLIDSKLAFTAGWDARNGFAHDDADNRTERLERQLELAAADIIYARVTAHLAGSGGSRSASVAARATELVDALESALPPGSLAPMSLDVLRQAFTAAYALDGLPHQDDTRPSVYDYAGILLGTHGDDDGRELAEAIRSEAADLVPDMAFIAGDRAISPLYVDLDPRQRAIATALPREIIAQLAAAATRWQLIT